YVMPHDINAVVQSSLEAPGEQSDDLHRHPLSDDKHRLGERQSQPVPRVNRDERRCTEVREAEDELEELEAEVRLVVPQHAQRAGNRWWFGGRDVVERYCDGAVEWQCDQSPRREDREQADQRERPDRLMRVTLAQFTKRE